MHRGAKARHRAGALGARHARLGESLPEVWRGTPHRAGGWSRTLWVFMLLLMGLSGKELKNRFFSKKKIKWKIDEDSSKELERMLFSQGCALAAVPGERCELLRSILSRVL